jgi:hypothetical protein
MRGRRRAAAGLRARFGLFAIGKRYEAARIAA